MLKCLLDSNLMINDWLCHIGSISAIYLRVKLGELQNLFQSFFVQFKLSTENVPTLHHTRQERGMKRTREKAWMIATMLVLKVSAERERMHEYSQLIYMYNTFITCHEIKPKVRVVGHIYPKYFNVISLWCLNELIYT